MIQLLEMGKQAKIASYLLATLSTAEKNSILLHAAETLRKQEQAILEENKKDVEEARKRGIKESLIDRLALSEKRIAAMAEGLEKIAVLDDPIGEILGMKKLPNGLLIGQKRVPFGVIGIIFEARPNVTADAYGLCLKSGNAVILRGGKEAIRSNMAIVDVFRQALKQEGYTQDFVQIVEDTSHESANEMMKMNGYIDVLIPRGSANLIQTVVKQSTVPVIETGVGNCHVFVDESGNQEKAVNIIINGKTQRPGVCNAVESLLIHEAIAEEFLPVIGKALKDKQVEIRGDEKVKSILPEVILAQEEDWGKEYLDYISSVKVVPSVDAAVEHIRQYGTKHSESIITENYTNAQKFLDEVDAAAVYVNASTRFTDGSEFGFGAEIGISTQKLHARGPMGLKELTTTKYIIYGNGQIRN